MGGIGSRDSDFWKQLVELYKMYYTIFFEKKTKLPKLFWYSILSVFLKVWFIIIFQSEARSLESSIEASISIRGIEDWVRWSQTTPEVWSQSFWESYLFCERGYPNKNQTLFYGLYALKCMADVLVFCDLFCASGSTKDWVNDKKSVPLSWTWELRDTGDYGFLLPPDQIVPNFNEVLEGIIALFKYTKEMWIFFKN